MKLRVAVIVLVCVAGALLLVSNMAKTESANRVGEVIPVSLDQFYPPKSHAPAYLLTMFDLARPFSGMMCDVLENDLDNARANFETFKKAYKESAGMIPEWKSRYPMKPVEEMGAALLTGDLAKIMSAADAVGAVCHQCHVTTMAPVQQKYRWDDFGNFSLTDPLSKQDISFARLMLMMETNFGGIGNNLSQGQVAEARKQFDEFQLRFEEMSEACMFCHDSERFYYVSGDIEERITELGDELKKTSIDPGAVENLLQVIGQESCSKCHLVHIPAAYGQQILRGN